MTTKHPQAVDDAVPDAEPKRAKRDERNLSILVVGKSTHEDRLLWTSNYRYCGGTEEFQRQFDRVYNEAKHDPWRDLSDVSRGYVKEWIDRHYYTEVGLPSTLFGERLEYRWIVIRL